MATFEFQGLPPSANHSYEPLPTGGRCKSKALIRWEDYAMSVVRGWTPPARVPLLLEIRFVVLRRRLHSSDISNMVKHVEDSVIGKRRDQWVDDLRVRRVASTDGREGVVVSVERALEVVG
jgi:Holliday junction resolvase RusA-like endonuclease